MRIGKVYGSVWATKKTEKLTGAKFLMVSLSEKESVIVTDTVGAGVGDTVLVCFGSTARLIDGTPTDAAICGIVDKTDVAGGGKEK